MIDEHFIREWIAHQEATKEDDDAEIHWTDEHLIDLSISEGGDVELWRFVRNTYKREMTDAVLAKNDEKFKKLLGGVWQNAMSDQLWARVCAVKGEPW